MLRERNKNYGTIKFVDISSKEYSPEENQGLDYETVCVIQHCYFFFLNSKGELGVDLKGLLCLKRGI